MSSLQWKNIRLLLVGDQLILLQLYMQNWEYLQVEIKCMAVAEHSQHYLQLKRNLQCLVIGMQAAKLYRMSILFVMGFVLPAVSLLASRETVKLVANVLVEEDTSNTHTSMLFPSGTMKYSSEK